MALLRLKKAYPNYRDTFSDSNLSNIDDYSVYTQGDDKVGSIEDGLFEDGTGRFRYLIVDTGPWIFGKKVLLPIGMARFDYDRNRVYVDGLSKQQVEELPEYKNDMTVDYDYEEHVRNVYRSTAGDRQFMGQTYDETDTAAVGTSAAVGTTGTVDSTAYTRDNYTYDNEPGMYGVADDANHPIRLYEERLIADKHRTKTGEVSVGKRVETESAEVSVPVESERVVIERTTPTNTTNTAAAAGTPEFKEGEVARMEIHEEAADIRKEAYVREEVNVRKEVDRDVVSDRETVRREELDIDTSGNPEIRRS